MKAFFDFTEPRNVRENQIVELVGESFDVWDLVKLPPVRSGNILIHAMHVNDLAFNPAHEDLWHCNIELRKKGIEIIIHRGLDRFSWCVPYYQLSVFQSTHLTIHANGYFIRLKDGYTLRQEFIQRMLIFKNEYLYNQ
ncbi:MAG: hypothetical protein Salg2KO_21200 [Salibacteraceae bacterium]